jgi:antitoxin ParD1/3/4
MELAKRTISLPAKHNSYIERKLKSGEYASASEVVREGLRALQERDAAIEYWLRGEVAATYDEMEKHPERGIPIEEAFKRLDARGKRP